MSKKVVLILAIAAVAAVVVGMMVFGGDNAEAPEVGTPQTEEAPAASESSAETNEQQVVAITFTNDGFSPGTLTVKKGTVVTVKNNSSMSVQFSSDDHPTHTINQGMNLPVLAAGASATFTADETGTFGYHDHIDASKTGTLVVTE